MVVIETMNVAIVKENVISGNFWTEQDPKWRLHQVVVNEEEEAPKWPQHRASAKIKRQTVTGQVRQEKHGKDQDRNSVAKRNGV